MTTLYFDIETLPADEASRDKLKFLFEKKRDKKVKRDKKEGEEVTEEENAKDFEDYYLKTSFDGAFGRVLCIAYALDDSPAEVLCNEKDEKKTLEDFWKVAEKCHLFVGHNIMDFDFRFLFQRSIVLGVKPSLMNLPFARYRNNPIYDTMCEWSKWNMMNKTSLEHIAVALGIPSPKEGIDGSQVFNFYKVGKVKEICEYCKRDVDTTRAVYKRINFLA